MNQELTLQLIVMGLGCLLGINAFFVRRLVLRIDRIDDIEKMIQKFTVEIENLRREVNDVSALKSEIAVLKYIVLKGKSENGTSN